MAGIVDGQAFFRELLPLHDELDGALAGGGNHLERSRTRLRIRGDADDGVAGDDQRRLAAVFGAERIGWQLQRGNAADLDVDRRGEHEERPDHDTVACTLPSDQCMSMASPSLAAAARATGRPQRLPSGLATIA